ncbi:MAG TPA: PKD domain-containing protein, partial [Bacteroidia bacterium]
GNIIWNPGNVIGNNFGASAGTYTVTVTGVNGCINETSFSVEDLGPPAFTASNDTCLNAPVPVNLSLAFDCASSASCGVTTNTSCASSGTIVQFGTGTEQNDDTEYPTPFGNYYKNTKQQYLYKAADLLAAGVTPGVINSIAFNVLQNNGTTVYDGFTIKMMCTNATDLDTSSNAPFLTGAQTVFNPATINVALGWNTFTFNNNYAWDGTSNIVVEICNALSTNFTDNAQVQLSVMNYAASVYYRSDATPACPQTTHNYFTPWNGFPNAKYIPNTRFGVGSINAAAYTYSWNVGSPTGPVVATTQTTTVTPPAGGQTTYFVTVSATNSGVTCSRVDSVRILVSSSQPQIFPDGAVLCTDDAIMGLTVVGAPGGSWSHNTTSGTGIGGGITPNGGNVDFNPAISALGQSYVTYTVGAANCILKDSVLMVVNPAVVPNFVVPANYCSYDPAISFNTLPVSCYPGTTCQWKIDGTVATGIDPAVLTATTHTVTYTTDAGGNCPRTATQTINVHTAPVVTFSADTLSGCLPSVPVAFTSTVTTTPAASNAYTWSFGDASTANVANPVHVYSQAGVMSVSLNYTDINGCADNETKISYITINTIPEPEFVFEPANPTSLEPHVQFYNTSRNSTGLTWEWDIAGLDSADYFNISYDFPASGTYNIVLTATSPAGCVASYTSPVTVRPDYVIYIPSGFSPNGDGKNDVFLPKYSELMKEDYIMSIYDRWGEKIFQTSDIAEGWKGSKGNSDNIVSESGVYIYKIIYKDAYGKGHSETGHVNLVR